MEHQDGNMKCFHPQTFNDNTVACGRCPACKQNRISGWVVRLEQHARAQESAHFITLTYSPENVPQTNSKLYTLKYSDVQSFLKNIRNFQNAENTRAGRHINEEKLQGKIRVRKSAISYYCAGEYGTRTSRPHYHLIMFNASLECIHRAWGNFTPKGWIPRGNVHTGNITGGSIRYTLKYISKPSRIPLFKGDDRTPEFSHMSKGIGKNYLSERIIKWHRTDILNRYFVPAPGGTKQTMPRYYADKIYTTAERQFIAEHLEKQSSDQFYKMVLQDDTFIRNYLEAIKGAERKSLFTKIQKL